MGHLASEEPEQDAKLNIDHPTNTNILEAPTRDTHNEERSINSSKQ